MFNIKRKKKVSKVLEVLQRYRESEYKDSVILGVASEKEEGKTSNKTPKGKGGL